MAKTVTSSTTGGSLERLMQAAMAGDAAAYRDFLTQVSLYLRRFVARRIPASDVEDVLQEILVSLHKARATYDGRRSILPWVSAIARYRVSDYLRRHYAECRQSQVDIAEVEDFLAAPVTEASALGESVSGEVGQLPERQQKILYLLHTEGYTAKEVGVKLGMQESAVKVAAHRAYKRIRERLQKT